MDSIIHHAFKHSSLSFITKSWIQAPKSCIQAVSHEFNHQHHDMASASHASSHSSCFQAFKSVHHAVMHSETWPGCHYRTWHLSHTGDAPPIYTPRIPNFKINSIRFVISHPDFGFPIQIWDFQPRFGISSPDFGTLNRPKRDAVPKKGTQKWTHLFYKMVVSLGTSLIFWKGDANKTQKGTQKGTHPFLEFSSPGPDFLCLGPKSTGFLNVGAQIWAVTSRFRIYVLKLAGCSVAPHTVHAHEPIQLGLDPLKAWVQLWQRPHLLLQVLPYRCTSY